MKLYEIVGILYDEFEKRNPGLSAPKYLQGKLGLSLSNIYKWREHPGVSGSNLPSRYFADVQALAPDLPLLIEYEIKQKYGDYYTVSYLPVEVSDGNLIEDFKELFGAMNQMVDVFDIHVDDMTSLEKDKVTNARIRLRLVELQLAAKVDKSKE